MQENLIEYIDDFNLEGVKSILDNPENTFDGNIILQYALKKCIQGRINSINSKIHSRKIVDLLIHDNRVCIESFKTEEKYLDTNITNRKHYFFLESILRLDFIMINFINQRIYNIDIDFNSLSKGTNLSYIFTTLANVDYLKKEVLYWLEFHNLKEEQQEVQNFLNKKELKEKMGVF